MLSTLLLGSTATLLTSCGFHLRGYNAPMTYAVSQVALDIEDNPTTFPLKQPLTTNLRSVGLLVFNENNRPETNPDSPQDFIATIRVDNVRFQRYELVGVLTEIRLVLSADVTYQTRQGRVNEGYGNTNANQNLSPITVQDTVQIERSYQFNEASVSVEDQQGEQIRDWLYEHLAQRITDQYVALSLPRVSAETLNNTPSVPVENQDDVNDSPLIPLPSSLPP